MGQYFTGSLSLVNKLSWLYVIHMSGSYARYLIVADGEKAASTCSYARASILPTPTTNEGPTQPSFTIPSAGAQVVAVMHVYSHGISLL